MNHNHSKNFLLNILVGCVTAGVKKLPSLIDPHFITEVVGDDHFWNYILNNFINLYVQILLILTRNGVAIIVVQSDSQST